MQTSSASADVSSLESCWHYQSDKTLHSSFCAASYNNVVDLTGTTGQRSMMPAILACHSSMATSCAVESRRGAYRDSKAACAMFSSRHHTTCVSVSGASPQRQSGIKTSKPCGRTSTILPVLACTSRALSCFGAFACLRRAPLILFSGGASAGFLVRS